MSQLKKGSGKSFCHLSLSRHLTALEITLLEEKSKYAF